MERTQLETTEQVVLWEQLTTQWWNEQQQQQHTDDASTTTTVDFDFRSQVPAIPSSSSETTNNEMVILYYYLVAHATLTYKEEEEEGTQQQQDPPYNDGPDNNIDNTVTRTQKQGKFGCLDESQSTCLLWWTPRILILVGCIFAFVVPICVAGFNNLCHIVFSIGIE